MQHDVFVPNGDFNDLNPIQFGTHQCTSSQDFGPAMRTYWLLHFVVSGQGNFYIDNKSYSVKPGDIFVIPPYVETRYAANKADPWSYIWIGFTAKSELPVKLDDIICCPAAKGIFLDMKKCEAFGSGRNVFLCAKLWELFAHLAENGPREYDPVEAAVYCIHTEFMRSLTIQQLSQRLGLNRSYFTTLFTRKIGVSPGRYLLEQRMKFAATLLTSNLKSVSVTASSVGYNDIYSFSKAFKQYYGVPPQEYVRIYSNADIPVQPRIITE